MNPASETEVDEELSKSLNSLWPFITIRESSNTSRILAMLPDDGNLEAIRLHFSIWNCIHEGRLLNSILDMPADTCRLSAPAAVHMACLYWPRRLLGSESTGPAETAEQCTTLDDAGPIILQSFNSISVRDANAPQRSSQVAVEIQPDSPQYYQTDSSSNYDESKLRLWVLYVAAMVQRATIASEGPQNFAIEFLEQTCAMRYTSLWQVRDEVRKTFLYDEGMDPAGDLWYEEVIGIR